MYGEVKPWSQDWLIAAGTYPDCCSMKRLEIFLLPLDGMLVHRRSLLRNLLGFPQQFTAIHLYIWVERGTVRVKCIAQDTTQCPRPRLEPGPLAPESSALTRRPPRRVWRNKGKTLCCWTCLNQLNISCSRIRCIITNRYSGSQRGLELLGSSLKRAGL